MGKDDSSPSNSSMITARCFAKGATERDNATARLIGCSMNRVDLASLAKAGVSSTLRHSSTMPSTSSYCSLPSRVVR